MRRYIISRKSSDEWYNNGIALFAEGRFEEAIEAFIKCIQLDLSSSILFYKLGSAYHQLNKYSDAIANYTKAIELDHRNIDAYEARASAYKSIGIGEKLVFRDLQKANLLRKNIEKNKGFEGPSEYRDMVNFPSHFSSISPEDANTYFGATESNPCCEYYGSSHLSDLDNDWSDTFDDRSPDDWEIYYEPECWGFEYSDLSWYSQEETED